MSKTNSTSHCRWSPAAPGDRAFIASIASVVPSLTADQHTFSHPSIRKRHSAVDGPSQIITEGPDQRVARFTEKSVELAAEAVVRSLDKVGLTVPEVTGVVVNTCTGYICPGISTYLMERLGMSPKTRLYDMAGSGCGGAMPNLQVAESMLKTTGGVVVSVAVEISSAAFQVDNDLSLILCNAIFGDGAAAAVLWNKPAGFELLASAGRYLPEHRDSIRFIHKQGQLYNQLSTDLPDLVRKAAFDVVGDLLSLNSLRSSDIRHWALHAGGDKIINAVRDEVGIPEERLWATRKVLAQYGNMSSPTVWFVMDEILQDGIRPGELCVMIAYGAGLSAHACLLRKT